MLAPRFNARIITSSETRAICWSAFPDQPESGGIVTSSRSNSLLPADRMVSTNSTDVGRMASAASTKFLTQLEVLSPVGEDSVDDVDQVGE